MRQARGTIISLVSVLCCVGVVGCELRFDFRRRALLYIICLVPHGFGYLLARRNPQVSRPLLYSHFWVKSKAAPAILSYLSEETHGGNLTHGS